MLKEQRKEMDIRLTKGKMVEKCKRKRTRFANATRIIETLETDPKAGQNIPRYRRWLSEAKGRGCKPPLTVSKLYSRSVFLLSNEYKYPSPFLSAFFSRFRVFLPT